MYDELEIKRTEVEEKREIRSIKVNTAKTPEFVSYSSFYMADMQNHEKIPSA